MRNKWVRCQPDPLGKELAWYIYTDSKLEVFLYKRERGYFEVEIRGLPGECPLIGYFMFPDIKLAREAKKAATNEIREFLTEFIKQSQLLLEEL